MNDVRRRRPGPAAAVACALVAFGCAACAPGSPDADSWRDDAVRTTGDVASAVSTLQLALEHRDRMSQNYLQVVAVDSEELAGTAAQRLSGVQPPESELKQHDDVTTALEDAADLVTEARIAVVRGDVASYPSIVDELGKTSEELSAQEDRLTAEPGDQP